MAGIKISALPAVPSALLTDFFPVVQAGVTSQETLQQVATLFTAQLPFVPLAGGTMTGPLILNTNTPNTLLQAASKGYVDSVAQGLTIQGACRAATIGALTATYNNVAVSPSGVGATLTNSGTQVAIAIDGVTLALNDRVLVKNQGTTLQNGIYTATNLGSGATNWVLTRATDYDDPAEIQPGDLVVITAGTNNTNSSWLQTSTVTSVGVSAITFSQFSASLPISMPNGGTGASLTPSNGGIFYSGPLAGAILTGTATAGLALLSGAAGAPSWSTAAPITQVVVQTFTASGTYTITPGMKFCTIECIGGASGGGGVANTLNSGGGGGGGGGSYSRKTATAATIGASQVVTIGAGGAGGAAGNNNGVAGGDTSVGTICIAKGGSAGGGSDGTNNGIGAAGGVAGTGDLTYVGNHGGDSAYGLSSANAYAGIGGGGPFGGSPGAQCNGAVAAVTGRAGGNYGSGGNGGSTRASGGNAAGGAGSSGVIIITEYVSV